MAEEKNIIIPFSEKADLVVSNIIEKYGLKENEEKTLKKLKENKLFNSNIIVKLTREFVKGTISEEELIGLFKKELEISQQIAEKISKDIMDNLVPLLEKIPEEELGKTNIEKGVTEKIITATPIKPPMGLKKTPSEGALEPVLKTPPKIQKPFTPKILEKNKEIKTPKKEDAYREPID